MPVRISAVAPWKTWLQQSNYTFTNVDTSFPDSYSTPNPALVIPEYCMPYENVEIPLHDATPFVAPPLLIMPTLTLENDGGSALHAGVQLITAMRWSTLCAHTHRQC